MTRKTPLSQQVVVVTGASAGLGRAVARLAASRGAKVVVVARDGDGLDACVAELEGLGAEAHAVQADVAVLDDVHRVVEGAVDRFGRIDTFCSNAMVTVYEEARDLKPEELHRVMEVNFFGGVNCYQASLVQLVETSGTFVQIASALSYRGIPLQAAYCSSKAALRTYFETARVEHMKHHIPVDISVVLPGAINTPQFDMARQYIGKQPQPVPPIYEPEPFAEGVVHCFEHPIRELPLGWGAQKLLWGQKLSPRAGDLMLLRIGWKGQHTGEAKEVGSADNLFEPLPGQKSARGRFSDKSRSSTLWTSLRLRRWLVGAAVAGVGLATIGLGQTRDKSLVR
ncbi:MAG TPA: SDR family oxidoreductase [Gaiellaceae bacterium]|nr:SDR family oxidoreductase [Gaiellaceae bacterium]